MKQYEIIISNQMLNELKIILLQTKKFSTTKAISLKENIFDKIEKLEENPEIAPYLEGDYIPKHKYHKLVLKENFIIIYQISENTIYIDYIFSAKQNYEWLL